MTNEIAGIDYSNGLANFDKETGIHYGVISLNSVDPEFLSEFEWVYPESVDDEDEDAEPTCFTYSKHGYELQYSPDSTFLWVFKSNHITECQFCSPSVPGAGDLDNQIEGGVKTYSLESELLNKEE